METLTPFGQKYTNAKYCAKHRETGDEIQKNCNRTQIRKTFV